MAADINFGDYSACVQGILPSLVPSTCIYDDTAETNDCLCADKSYLIAAMQHIKSNCGCNEVINAAGTSFQNCQYNGSPSVLSENQLVSAGGCHAASSGTPISTTPSNNDSPTSDHIALGVGLGLGIPTLAITAFGVWYRFGDGRNEWKRLVYTAGR